MARNDNTIVTIFVVGVGLYIVYEIVRGLKAAAGAAATAISAAGSAAYRVAATATTPISAAIVGVWNTLAPLQQAMHVTGNILWPDGTYTPLSQTPIRADNLGNVYAVDSGGLLYQLQPSDINGDFPASQITDPSQIGRALS